MTTRVIFLNRLVPGATAEGYERWVRERDYPTARSLKSIISYEVLRVEGPLRDNGVDYDYIEIVEITNPDSYRAELESFPGRDRFVEEIRSHVGPADAVVTTLIE